MAFDWEEWPHQGACVARVSRRPGLFCTMEILRRFFVLGGGKSGAWQGTLKFVFAEF